MNKIPSLTYIYDTMWTFYWNFSLSNYWEETNYFEIVTFTASKPWLWAIMLRNMNKCENGWSNFSVSSRVVALKWSELIQFELLNHWISSISYVPLFAKWRHELSFSFRWACIFFSLVYIYFCWVYQMKLVFWIKCYEWLLNLVPSIFLSIRNYKIIFHIYYNLRSLSCLQKVVNCACLCDLKLKDTLEIKW